MMLGTRELSIEKLPESSRNWINEKLIYTHGYGVTMNPVNGFTPEGLPTLLLGNMPVQSTVAEPQGHAARDLLRRADEHRRLRARRGRRSSTTRRARPTASRRTRATGGIVLGGFFRRLLIALDRGDLAKLPFSDDVTGGQPAADAAQHPRARRARSRRSSPSIPIRTSSSATTAGCVWMMDAFTTSDVVSVRAPLPARPRARSTTSATASRSSSTRTTARRRSTCSTPQDPIVAAYRAIFPDAVQGRVGDAGRTCGSTCAIPELHAASCRPPSTGCIT